MPQYLGVSKAILDSVIFCHQDESLWPMSEPAALKKRFDDIFEAQKYTKAVDNIKQLRKDQSEKLKQFEIHEKYSKETKDRADKAEKTSRKLQDEVEELREELEALKIKGKDAGSKAQIARDHAAQYTEVIEKLKVFKSQRDWYNEQLRSTELNLVERSESDEFLESELSQYEERVKRHQQREDEQTARYNDVEREIVELRQHESKKRVEHGKLEQQKTTYEKRLQEREEDIKACASKYSLRGYNMGLDDKQITEFMEKIIRLSNSQSSQLEELRTQSRAEARQIQEDLDELREKQTSSKEAKSAAKKQLSLNEQRMNALYGQLNRYSTDESAKTTLEAKEQDLNGKLEDARRQLSSGSFEVKICQSKAKVQECEEDMKALNQEFMLSTDRAAEVAKLDHLKKQRDTRQNELETMKMTHGARLEELLHADWQPSRLETQFQQLLEEMQNDLNNAKSKRDAKSQEQSQVQFQFKTVKDKLRTIETEINKCSRIIREKTGGNPDQFPQDLEDAQSDLKSRQADVDAFIPMQEFFQKAIETASSDNPKCLLCHQKISSKTVADRFMDRLRTKFSDKEHESLKEELKNAEKEFKKVKDASQTYDTWKRLSEVEMPLLHAERSRLGKQDGDLNKELDDMDLVVNDRTEKQREVERFAKPVANVGKCLEDVKGLQQQVETLENESQAAGFSGSLDDIKNRLEDVEKNQKTAKANLAKLENDDKQIRDRINGLQLESERTKNKLTSANHELREQTSINNQIEDLRTANRQQRDMTEKADEETGNVTPMLAAKQKQLEEVHLQGVEKERHLQKKANQLSDEVRNLQRGNQEIEAYKSQGGTANLTQCRSEISSLESQISSSQAENKQRVLEINKIRKELDNQANTKRIITDNLNYRKMKRDLQETEENVAQLSAQNAENDQQNYLEEAERWAHEFNRIVSDRSAKLAVVGARDKQLGELLQEWDTEYKDAAQSYRKAHIHVETTKAAVEDLLRYSGALDKAIMRFHSLKMEQINHSIRELWQATYQGTDVDTILIRSDEAVKGNRSYNYRVCMVKQDAEMDMRGRCSAGQKVLASIIIRLALAECFGEHCGLIALDEPTTNLDRDNIKSLAESLHKIIKQRQAQRNFQLIVITHDEEFLKFMKCGEFCDNYYRVSRDGRQKSIIERQRIADVL